MFDVIRNNKRIVQIFLVLIAVPFALFGLDTLRSGGGAPEVARVGTLKVPPEQFRSFLQDYQASIRQQFPGIAPDFMNSPEFMARALADFTDELMLNQEAEKKGIVVSDAVLRQLIENVPAFQEEGRFSAALYKKMLSGVGKTELGFEQDIRRELQRKLLLDSIGAASFVPEVTLDRVKAAFGESRQIQMLLFEASEFARKLEVDEAAMTAFYEANQKRFMAPELIRVEYVVMDQKAFEAQAKTGEAKADTFVEMAEGLRDLAFNQPESLDPVVERYKLPLQQSEWIGRNPDLSAGVLAHPKLIAALFTDSVIQQGHNAEVVEVAPGVVVAARMLEHKPAALRPLDEVRAEIEGELRQQQAVALAVKAGEEKLAMLKAAKEDTASAKEAWSSPKMVSRLASEGLSRDAISAVFRLSPTPLPAYAGAEVPGAGYAVFRLQKVEAGQADPGILNSVADQQKTLVARLQEQAYLQALRQRYKVEHNLAALVTKTEEQ